MELSDRSGYFGVDLPLPIPLGLPTGVSEGIMHSFVFCFSKGLVINYREGGGYKMGKSRVRNFLRPPPLKTGSNFSRPPF